MAAMDEDWSRERHQGTDERGLGTRAELASELPEESTPHAAGGGARRAVGPRRSVDEA
jgi:hypothetical protein